MRTIGMIGGTSWFSTIDYYRVINQQMNDRLGGNASAKILLYSVNFEEIAVLSRQEDWEAVGEILLIAARNLELAGAQCLLLCANTMHLCAEKVQAGIGIPVIHIADIVVKNIQELGIDRVLLLGTKYTMLADFYAERLKSAGIELIIPSADKLEWINSSIYQELGKGLFLPQTKEAYIGIINDSISQGAQGVILGCTEIPLLIKKEDIHLPLFDTTILHSIAAVDFALR
ncbi:MAG: aspartate/glutamate racemase family protein [Bacteroidota bacterium]